MTQPMVMKKKKSIFSFLIKIIIIVAVLVGIYFALKYFNVI